MSLAALLAEAEAAGVELKPRLWVQNPGRLSPGLRARLQAERSAILLHLAASQAPDYRAVQS